MFFLLRGDEDRILHMVDSKWGAMEWADFNWKMAAVFTEKAKDGRRLMNEYAAQLRDKEWDDWNSEMEAQYDANRERKLRGVARRSLVLKPRNLILKTKEEVAHARKLN